jgi:pectate lyase
MNLTPCPCDARTPGNRSQARLNCSLPRWFVAAALLAAGAAAAAERQRDDPRDELGQHAVKCLETVRAFADTVLDKGRDRYGARHTPLFVDGLHVETAQPVIWMGREGAWVISNFINQQPLMRLLDGLSAVTGDTKYREAAEAAAAHVLEHLVTPNGLLHWGGHRAWDLAGDKPVGQNVHEIKTYQPYYELMWRVNPAAARRLAEAMWGGHITDWELLDYNRHASSITSDIKPRWDAVYNEHTPVPWLAKARTLSFANVTPPLLQAGASLFFHENDEEALRWTRRLARRWQEAKHPETGLSGGQLSYWTREMGCRAQQGLGHVHPEIHEAMMITTYHRQSRYHDIPLVQMQLGEELLRGRKSQAAFGRELIDWAVADLKAYGRHAYDPELNAFVPLLTDGTRLQWEQVRPGYYRDHLDSLGPAAPDSRVFRAYAKAYRLSRDAGLWEMIRHLSRAMGFGEVGSAAAEPRHLRFSSGASWVATDRHGGSGSIYGMLELHRATGDRAFLQVAAEIADHLVRTHFRNGLFPRAGRVYARTGDEIPLALLHLVAAIENKSNLIPVDKVDSQFYHDIYFGPLERHQMKPGDARTRDNLVFYDPLPSFEPPAGR